jgi:CheY-like chemotaxis protein
VGIRYDMKKKILVVDDNPSLILSVKAGLDGLASGYEVIGVTGGKECFDFLEKGNLPDLILLDIMMPLMDGWEVKRKLGEQAEWRKIPIMFLTAVTDKTSKKLGTIIGKDFIEKPFEILDLKNRLDAFFTSSNKKVMVVDDDPTILLTVRVLFESEGIEVTTVGSGQECIAELQKGFKGVILMDVMMPHMDGWETIREIVAKGFHKGTAIFMLSAKDKPDGKDDSFKGYVIDYIEKPFEPAELVSTVKKYCSNLKYI